jgi:putative ABC transport system substrate-binding protein
MKDAPMQRRSFITLLGGAAAAWPLAVRAQQRERTRRVAILMPYPPTDAAMQTRIRAFEQELARLGWTRNRNVQFDERWTTDNMDLIRANTANLVELKPDVIVATGGRVVPILMQLTRSIPIIIPGTTDPVVTGWAESLARPGGNVTGFTISESSVLGKLLETLKLVAPAISHVAMIYNPDNAIAPPYVGLFETFARSLAIEPIIAPVHGIGDIDRIIESLAQQRNSGAYFHGDLSTTALRDQVTALVARHRVPAIYVDRIFISSGGLVSYDSDRVDIYRRSASYVDRILRGEKPSDLPFQQPTKYQLTINLRAARALGLDISPIVLSLADEVIE